MNLEQYNQAIIQFYSNAFLQLSLKSNSLKIDINQKSRDLTDNFAVQFHNYIAKDFLDNLANQNPSIQDKLKNYPEQFWLTLPGREYFEKIQDDITSEMTSIILAAIKNNEKLDHNMLSTTIDNLVTIYQQDLKSGKKQLLKLKKELTTHKNLKHMPDLLPLLGQSIIKSKKENKILKNIKEDFEILL